MNFLRRILVTVLILSVFGLHFPKITLAAQSRLFAKAVGITEHLPEILAPPEEEIPVEEVKKEKSRTWLWVLGAVVLVGIIAVAAGGGGGGGGGGGDSGGDDVSNTGDITVSW